MEAIIFDYGGVLCFHPTDEQLDGMAAACGLPRQVFLDAYWGLRIEYDRGDFTAEEYWQRFAAVVDREYTAEQVKDFRRRDVEFWIAFDHRMLHWLVEMRNIGIKLGLISNLPYDLGEYLRTETQLFPMFDYVTLSYEQRVVKPDAPIYLECCQGLGISPAQALFLDDREQNVLGAEAAGLKSIVFETPEQLAQVLASNHDLVPFGTPPIMLG